MNKINEHMIEKNNTLKNTAENIPAMQPDSTPASRPDSTPAPQSGSTPAPQPDSGRREFLKRHASDGIRIFIGSTITAFAVQYIFDPSGLVTGGVSGLAIIIKYLTENAFGVAIPLWLSTLVLNVPIFILAIFTDGFKSVIRSGLSWMIQTVELAIFPAADFMGDNLLLVAVYGGLCFGVGTGLLLDARATTGGTDMLGNSLHKYIRFISVGVLIQMLDGAIVILGAFIFNIEHTLYAIISVFIMGVVIDYIMARGRRAKIAFIISNASEEIAHDILYELDRGITGLQGRGMYSNKERTILVCICSNKDIVEMKDVVRKYDPKAFFVIANVSEAMGEGFADIRT